MPPNAFSCIRFDHAQQLVRWGCPSDPGVLRAGQPEDAHAATLRAGDAYFTALSADWSEGVRKVFRELPELKWQERRRFGRQLPPILMEADAPQVQW